MHLTRIATLALLAPLLGITISVLIAVRLDPGEPVILAEPVAELVVGRASAGQTVAVPVVTFDPAADADVVETVEWAVGRYLAAGLQLPDLHISVPAACQGRAGSYVVGGGEIRICSVGRRLVLHEMAHAWDDHGQVDRQAFLAARGLDEWYEWNVDDKHESGGEQLAHLLAWGLMDIDTMRREMTEVGQAFEDQRRFLAHLEDLEVDEVHALFEKVTGVQAFSLSPAR